MLMDYPGHYCLLKYAWTTKWNEKQFWFLLLKSARYIKNYVYFTMIELHVITTKILSLALTEVFFVVWLWGAETRVPRGSLFAWLVAHRSSCVTIWNWTWAALESKILTKEPVGQLIHCIFMTGINYALFNPNRHF